MGLYQILTAPGSFKFYAEKSFQNPNAVSTPNSFGQKRIGYGDSNQPYIRVPLQYNGANGFNSINGIQGPAAYLNYIGNLPLEIIGTLGAQFSPGFDLTSTSEIRYNSKSWGPDFLTRGNVFGLIRTSDDVLRLTKYFTDNRSVNGELFIAKQNLLSRVSPKTEASYGLGYGLGAVNNGVYLPTSTLLQTGVSLFGGHVFKQGIDPTGLLPGTGLRSYQQAIYENQLDGNKLDNNRLYKLSQLSYIVDSEVATLNVGSTYDIALSDTGYFLKYGGGPDSFLGIGNTKIKYATDNTGQNPLLTFSQFSQTDTLNYLTWDRGQLSILPNDSKDLYNTPTVTGDFRDPLIATATENQYTFLSISPSYVLDALNTGNIEKRTNFRGAGARGNRLNYQEGKKELGTGTVVGPTDLINAFPIYQGVSATDNELVKDLIDFRIGIYDNDKIGAGPEIPLNWLHFRVLLDDFSDSYGSDWKAINYMGRAENFYKYESFKRDISLGFTVAAQSKQELLPIYKKLNYLASSMAPSYSDNGFIRGNLCRITLGNWLWEQPGFISSVDLSIPSDSPWEINLPIDGVNPDRDVKQVPHMVQVKIKFTPIHRFRPEINKFKKNARTPVFFKEDADNFSPDNLEFNDPAFGPQRYIALQDETTGNAYDYNATQEQQSVFNSIEQNNELAYSNSNINEELDDSAWGSAQTNETLAQVDFTAPSTPSNPDLVLGNQGSILIP